MGYRTTRADDERLLEMVAARHAGETSGSIARRHGLSRQEIVRVATNRVRDADLAESGEPAGVVTQAYWGH